MMMSRALDRLVTGGVCLLVGALVAQWAGRRTPFERPPAVTRAAALSAPAEDARGERLSRAELVSVLRSELTQALARCAPAATASPVAGAPPARPSAEQERTRTTAMNLVQTAIRDGHWTHEQALQLRPLLAQLPQEAQAELLTTLMGAINQGQMTSDIPPL
jgi:hypothetical protein